MKRRLVNYYDSTYELSFKHNKFTGFRTCDSLLIYSEKERLFKILNPYRTNTSSDSFITIRLKDHSVTINGGAEQISLDTVKPDSLHIFINGFPLYIDTSKENFPSFGWYSGQHYFFLDLTTHSYKKWIWDISESHDSSHFKIFYNGCRHYRMEMLFIDDERLKYGMLVSTSFRSSKHISRLRSFYTVTTETEKYRLSSELVLQPSYFFEYNVRGRLKRKFRDGAVYCIFINRMPFSIKN